MAKIIWTEEAVRRLKDIYDYISFENPSAARKVIDGIYEKASLLKDFPEIGYLYRREKEGTISILLYGHYRIAYLIKTESAVEILGIFHGAMKIEKYLT